MLRANLPFRRSFAALVAGVVVALSAIGFAAPPPWATLVPFKKIDADPNKNYDLEEKNGPWMIMAASFAGPSAEQQSHDLVLELRQRFKLEAYTFRRTYDFSKPTDGLGYSRYGGPRRMRYLTNHKFDEIAVLVGNYPSIDDADLEKVLEILKYARPECLDPNKRPDSSQRLAGLRTLYHLVSANP